MIMYVSHEDWDDFVLPNLVRDGEFRDGAPLVVRFLGTIGSFENPGVGLLADAGAVVPPTVTANSRMMTLAGGSHQITFEGVGPDAEIYGWGMFTGGSVNIVVRNLGFSNFFQQGLRASGNTTNFWVHHNTFYFGQNRFFFNDEETDRTMGQGSVDIEQNVRGYTIGYNHFNGGRGTHLIVGGVQNQPLENNVHRHYGTLHHNIYDSAQERNPRTRHHNLHMFNNLFRDVLGHPMHYRLLDRYTGYGIGAAHNATIWAEGNIFDDVGFPFLRSRHGHARGYYPHTGHNHFWPDGPGFIVTGDNISLATGESVGGMTLPTLGADLGYRNTFRGLSNDAEHTDFVNRIGQLQPNVMCPDAYATFDSDLDVGITVSEAAVHMMPPEDDILFNHENPHVSVPGGMGPGFPALNANAANHGWGFEGDFRPSTNPNDIMSTATLEEVATLRAHVEQNAGNMQTPTLHVPTAPSDVTTQLNGLEYFMHRQGSPMPSLRTITYGNTFTLNWNDSHDPWTDFYEIEFLDGATWRALGTVPNNPAPNAFITQDVTDFGFMVMRNDDHDWIAVHLGGDGYVVMYPRIGFGHADHPHYTEADIPTVESLRFTEQWVVADVVNGGTYNFRIRAVNDAGVSGWTEVSHTVAPETAHVAEVVQQDEINPETAGRVTFEVNTVGMADGTYPISLSVPRSVARNRVPWPAQQNFSGSIFLEGATDLVIGNASPTTGNGGAGSMAIADGVGVLTVELDDTVLEDLFDLVLTIQIDGQEIAAPFALIVGELPVPPIELPHAGTWFEAVYAEWYGAESDQFTAQIALADGAWTDVDAELVRYMGAGVWRVDMPGLAANDGQVYRLRIAGSADLLFEGLAPEPFNRQGFAFYQESVTMYHGQTRHFPNGTTGGHNPDGSVAPDTEIWYITHENRNDLALLSNRTEPLIVRIIGTVGNVHTGQMADLPANLTFQNHLMIENSENITIEGVGPDAVIEGWGFSPSSTHNIIIRNLTFEHSRHDSVWLRGPSTHAWITHNTFTVSGDGASDVGSGATNFTISYNHYIGTIQTMLANGNDREPTYRATYHGNWFYHGHSRHPMIRAGQIHAFNNFYDFEGRPAAGIVGHNAGGQGVDVRDRASGIVEGNYFLDTNARIAITQTNGGTMIHPAMSTDEGVTGTGNNMIRGLNVDNLLYVEARAVEANAVAEAQGLPVTGDTFGDPQAFIDSLVPNHSVGESTGAYNGTLSRGFGNHNIGNIGGGNNITPEHINHFDPFNPRLLLPGFVDVMPGDQVRNHVRENAGPIRRPNVAPAPDHYDVHSHIQQPIISQMHINPDGTFYIRTARSPWANFYTWEWDQGTGDWEPIHGELSAGTSDGQNSPQQAYMFESFDEFTASQGGTYQFRVTAHNTRVDATATSEVFTITHHYVDMETATPVERDDLTQVVFAEDFEGDEWALGPVRDQAQLEYLGIGVRRFQYLFNTNIAFDPSRLAAGVTHVRDEAGDFIVNTPNARLSNSHLPDVRRNDAYIINETNAQAAATFDGNNPLPAGEPTDMINAIENVEFDGNALLLRDWNWNNQSDQERYATFMHMVLPQPVMTGRVSVSYDFLLNRSHASMGAGIVPIQLYDTNGNIIMRRTANGSPATNGDYNPGLSLVYPSWQEDTNIWMSIEVVLDFDEMEFDVWLYAGEGWFLYEYNVPIPAHIDGLGYIVANTATGNHANSAMNLAIDNIVVATPEVTPPPRPCHPWFPQFPNLPCIPVLPELPGLPQLPGIPGVPGVPGLPSLPGLPGLPDIPAIPPIPGPSLPGIPPLPPLPGLPWFPRLSDALSRLRGN